MASSRYNRLRVERPPISSSVVLLLACFLVSPLQPRATVAASSWLSRAFLPRAGDQSSVTAAPVPRRKLAASLPCMNSTLFGFNNAVPLGDSLILHWKPQNSMTTEMALEAKALTGAQKGWVSVGWSGDGNMPRSDAVIGNVAGYPSNVVGVYLAGKRMEDVKPAGYNLGNTSVEPGKTGSFVVKFSRRVDDGFVRFDPTGTNKIIWAYSASGSDSLAFHGSNKGSALVDFSCTGKAAAALGARVLSALLVAVLLAIGLAF